MSNKIFILGAGITGLTAGRKLAEAGYRVKIIEINDFAGGMAATFKHNDYLLDYGPHKIFTVLDHIMQEINLLFEHDELLSIEKSSKVRLQGKYLNFPLGVKDIFIGLGVFKGFQCGWGYFVSLIKNLFHKQPNISYEDWVINKFGKPIYQLVLEPYANKIWGPPDTLSKELAESRIAAPHLLEMIKQMLFGQKKDAPVINAKTFHYPRNGAVEISNKLMDKITAKNGEIVLNKSVSNIVLDKNLNILRLLFSDGSMEELSAQDTLISTIPLSSLFELLKADLSGEVKKAVSNLKTRKLILLYVALNKDVIINDNWLFFPEKKYIFNRIFEQKAFSPYMVGKNKTVLCAEITCDEHDPLWHLEDHAIFERALPQLKEAGLITGDIIEHFTKRLDNAYPVYDINYKDNLSLIMTGLNCINNLFSIGRQGGFSYTGMADSMDIGISTADFIIKGKDRMKDWLAYSQRFYNYLVVD